jgi:hypothetical protein
VAFASHSVFSFNVAQAVSLHLAHW